MADLISRRPPRPYKLPESTQTSGKYTQQQYARPEVLTSDKKPKYSKAQVEKAQNIANRINSIREERIRLLFPDATPGTSFENYKQNELQNALDTLPPDQLNRYNWLVSKDQELRGELTKIIGSQPTSGQPTQSRSATSTTKSSQVQSQWSAETQQAVDKYVKGNKINISQMAKDAVAEGYSDYKGGKDIQDKWNNITKELGIAGEFSQATELAVISRLYGDKSGSINVERMIADGYSEEYAEKMLGVGKQQYADIKTVSAYKTDDGNVDVIRMINELDQTDVQRITGITDTEYHDLKQVARYIDDQGNVDVAAMVESGATYSFLNRVLNISQHDYDKIKTHFEAQEILEPYVDNGQLNLVGAVEAGHLGEIQQVYDINNEDLQQVFYYLELKSSGYIDDSGNVDVIKIISDGKVSEQTLTGALNLDTETLNTYKTVAQYLDADGNVDLVGVVEDGKLPEIQQVYNLSNDDLTRVFSYLELKKAGYVNDDGNVDVLSAIKDDKITDKVITGALNLDTETLNTYKTVAQYLDADGNVDLVGVVEDGKLPDVQKVLNLGNEELTKAFDYLEIKGAGYVDDEGNVNVIKAIADGKVSDRTLTNALDLDNDTMTNYKAVANYVDDEGNIDVLQAITDDVSYDILSIVGIDKTEYDNLKTISQYTDKEGQIDVVKALYHGVDPDILQSQLKLSEGEMQELKDYAKYEYWEPDKGISVNDLEAKLDTPGQPEWTKVIMAMKAAGVITSDGIPVDDEGYPIAGTALKKEWNKLTPEQKQAVADEWMGSWERVAVTGDKAMAGLEELTQKISSDKKAPKWVTEALKVVFPQLHMFDYTVNPEAKAKVDEVKTNVQNWVHSQINTHLRQHSIDDPSKGKRFAMGAATAVADIVSAIMIDIPIALHGIGEQVNEGEFRNAAAQSVALGGGMLLFPVTLPKKVLKEKSSGAGYVTGTVATLVLGPGSIIKLAKKGRTYIDPYGIPDRMAAIEFATGRIPVKRVSPRLLQDLVTDASKEIISGKESGSIRRGGWELTYRTTPIQRSGASAVFHGSPDVTPMAKLKPGDTFVVNPDMHLFTSVYATPRFVASTSRGIVGSKPGYVMILTDAGKLMTRESKTAGITGPYKTYKNAVETEVVANPTSTFTRSKNLRTRILGPKAGEFFTQYMGPDAPGIRSGQLVPVVVLLDKTIKPRAKTTQWSTIGKPNKSVINMLEQLPPVKDNMVRVVHGTDAISAKAIKENGLYSVFQDGIQNTTNVIKKNMTQAEKNAIQTFAGGKHYSNILVFDIPTSVYKKYAGLTKLTQAERLAHMNEVRRFIEAGGPKSKIGFDRFYDLYEMFEDPAVKSALPSKYKMYTRDSKAFFDSLSKKESKLLDDAIWEQASKEFLMVKVPTDYIVGEVLSKNNQFVAKVKNAPSSPPLEAPKAPLSPATLYAAKLTMIREALIDYATALKHPKRTIKDIVKRRQGPPGVREMEIARIARDMETKAVENVVKDLKGKPLKDKRLDDALRAELERQFRIEADRIYRQLGNRNLEAYYRTPEGQRRYEELYVSRMEPVMRDAVRTYQTTDAITRTAVEYTESMPRATLETTGLEVERELPTEERYIMTVKRRQSLREHPRVNVDRADARITDDRATLDARALSIPVEPRIMTSATRAELRAAAKTTQPKKVTVPPVRFPPPKYPYSKDKTKPKKELKKGKGDEKKRPEKPGTIHWRQGMWWISLIPRGRDKYVKVYTKAPPPGAPTKKRTPEETFFIKGGPDKVPKELLVDMGMQSVKISPTGEPNLRFKRRRRR